MNIPFSFADIIIVGLAAAFLIYRLYQVLGQRFGTERQRPNLLAEASIPISADQRSGQNKMIIPDDSPHTLAKGLRQIQEADSNFYPSHFLRGARNAFKLIVTAFAEGDRETLRPLLAPAVFENFISAIEAREKAGNKQQTTLIKITDIDFKDARLEAPWAQVTLEITSHQIHVTRDSQGQIIDGHPERVLELKDVWTFRRDIRSLDPNWQLAATDVSSGTK